MRSGIITNPLTGKAITRTLFVPGTNTIISSNMVVRNDIDTPPSPDFVRDCCCNGCFVCDGATARFLQITLSGAELCPCACDQCDSGYLGVLTPTILATLNDSFFVEWVGHTEETEVSEDHLQTSVTQLCLWRACYADFATVEDPINGSTACDLFVAVAVGRLRQQDDNDGTHTDSYFVSVALTLINKCGTALYCVTERVHQFSYSESLPATKPSCSDIYRTITGLLAGDGGAERDCRDCTTCAGADCTDGHLDCQTKNGSIEIAPATHADAPPSKTCAADNCPGSCGNCPDHLKFEVNGTDCVSLSPYAVYDSGTHIATFYFKRVSGDDSTTCSWELTDGLDGAFVGSFIQCVSGVWQLELPVACGGGGSLCTLVYARNDICSGCPPLDDGWEAKQELSGCNPIDFLFQGNGVLSEAA